MRYSACGSCPLTLITVSTNYPIIAITLRNNLRTLFPQYTSNSAQYAFSLIAIVPPVIVAYCTQDVELLTSVTGAYAGVGIQYITPALLCYYGRKQIAEFADVHLNPHRYVRLSIEETRPKMVYASSSICKTTGWIVLVCAWSVIALGLVTVYLSVVYFPDLNKSSNSTNPSCSA